MKRFVFFSFDYDDVKNFKVNVVRNSWRLSNDPDTFVDGSLWEKSKAKGPNAIMNLINQGLAGTSVTAVLIGQSTSRSRWVKYEIVSSFDKGNGLVAIHVNRIRGKDQHISPRGKNPFDYLGFQVSQDGKKIRFYELIERSWKVFKDLPEINNKKSNTLAFEDDWWNGNEFGKFFKFSDKFATYCWDMDNGYDNLTNWVENAVRQAQR